MKTYGKDYSATTFVQLRERVWQSSKHRAARMLFKEKMGWKRALILPVTGRVEADKYAHNKSLFKG